MTAGSRASWRRFAPILAVQFIGTLGYSIAIPFLVFLVTDLGGVAWTYGFVGATYSACQLVGAPILGRWSDRAGRRRVLALSQAGTLLAWLLFLGALALPKTPLTELAGATITVPLVVIFVARALDGITGGNVSVASAYVADLTEETPEERQLAFGWMGMAAAFGFTLGPALAGGLAHYGYAGPVAAAIAFSAVATVLCFRLEKEPGHCPKPPPPAPPVPSVVGYQHELFEHDTASIDPEDIEAPAEPPPPPDRSALRTPTIALLLVATFTLFLAFNLFYAGFPVHAERALGWEPTRMGSFFALLSAAMIIAQGPLLRLASARLPAPAVFVIGMLGLTAAFAVFALGDGPTMYLGAVLFALGNGLAWPTFQARLADAARPEDQGVVQGAATSAGSLASILGLVVGGILYPTLGVGLFVAGAVLFALVTLGTPAWFRKPTP